MFEKRRIHLGLNKDDDQRTIQNGEYTYALNCRVGTSDNENYGAVENTKGNVLVQFLLPPGTNKCVGAWEEKDNRFSIYMVYNSNNEHLILQFFHDSNVITEVFRSADLAFAADRPITGINMVDDLLYWSDARDVFGNITGNPPRKINITTAKAASYRNTSDYQIMDAIKYPPLKSPLVVYADDLTKKTNYLNNATYQLKTRFVYDDGEKSAWSPISQTPVPNIVFDDFYANGINNALDVTFETGAGIVTKIEVAVRTGNLGDFSSVETLVKDDLNIADNSTYTYRFYNNGIYTSLDIRDSNRLFDNVPQITGAQSVIEGERIVYGDITEGYDNVKIDASLSVEYTESAVKNKFSIRGRIYIKNPYAATGYLAEYQPIHTYSDVSSEFGFGGIGVDVTGELVVPEATDATKQVERGQGIPLGGFVVYLAGSDYKSVSKQVKATGREIGIQNDLGVYRIGSQVPRKELVQDNMQAGNVYSEFEIQDVVPGRYILRLASHLTTSADLLDITLPYQKTSTYTLTVGGSTDNEVEVIVTNSDVTIGDTVVLDLTKPQEGFSTSKAYKTSGYLVDDDTAATTVGGALADTRIELAAVTMERVTDPLSTDYNSVLSANTILRNKWLQGKTYTDHNGFWFFTNKEDFIPQSSNVSTQDTMQSRYVYGSSGDTLAITNNSATQTTDFRYILRNNNTDIRAYFRSRYEGVMTDSNSNLIQGVSVIIARGAQGVSDSNGAFSVKFYADTIRYDVYGSDVRVSQIYFTTSTPDFRYSFNPTTDGIAAAFTSGGTSVNPVSPYGGLYNFATPITAQTLLATRIRELLAIKAHKRGGEYKYALQYYDHGNRSGTANTSPETQLSILFYTEAFPTSGNIPPDGPPVVSWEIRHLPPEWATHYQWVRTKNTATNRYVQWASNLFTYVDKEGNTTTQGAATQIKISLVNMFVDYVKEHPDSNVSYDFKKNDRIRFIADENGNLYGDYFDYSVTGYDETDNSVIIRKDPRLPLLKDGVSFELYTPKLEEDQEIFYEVGEVFSVGNPGTNTRYHAGPTQNQSSANPSGVPATGTFTNGDAYYRERTVLTNSSPRTEVTFKVDDVSQSDFYVSDTSDIGRPTVEDADFKRTRRKNVIYYSDRYIPATNINGLSAFFSDAFEEYERNYGAIRLLYGEDKRLEVYQEFKVGAIPVNESIIFDNAGNSVLGTSEKVLNRIQYYAGEWGIGRNPESFATYGKVKYFYDVNRGSVLRLSTDGLTPISEYKMHNFFIDKSNELLKSAQDFQVFGVYDRQFDEYILAFGRVVINQPDVAITNTGTFTETPTTPDAPDPVIDTPTVGGSEVVEETPAAPEFIFGWLALDLINNPQPAIPASETVTTEIVMVRNDGDGSYTWTPVTTGNPEGLAVEYVSSRDVNTGQYIFIPSYLNNARDLNRPEDLDPITVAFSEKINKWVTFYSYFPDTMSTYGTGIITWNGGKLYVHNLNSVYNNFYGFQYNSEIWVPGNEQDGKNKIYQALEQEADTIWDAYSIVTLHGQETEMIGTDFERLEDIFWAAFWRDKHTPNTTLPLVEGDPLVDVSVIAKFRNADTTLTKIYSVGFKYVNSELSNR
jgi:hypothetical protein